MEANDPSQMLTNNATRTSQVRTTSMSAPTQVLTQRPALVTFAAVMLFIAGGFQLVFALMEFINAAWLSGTTYGTFGGHLWIWGILDALLAFVLLYSGYDLLRGGPFGFIMGLMLAGFSALRWFFYIPSAPFLALVVIGVDILIIYGLISSADYFRDADSRRMSSL